MIDGLLRTRDELNNFATLSCYGIVLSIMQLDFVCNYKVFNQVGQLLPFPLILTIHQRQAPYSWSHLEETRQEEADCLSIMVPNKEFLPSPKRQGGPSNTGDSAGTSFL